jgi:hypothetical protein
MSSSRVKYYREVFAKILTLFFIGYFSASAQEGISDSVTIYHQYYSTPLLPQFTNLGKDFGLVYKNLAA